MAAVTICYKLLHCCKASGLRDCYNVLTLPVLGLRYGAAGYYESEVSMKRYQRAVVWCAAVCAAGMCFVQGAEALVLRGQFPVHNGMYWNFSDNATQQQMTWAVLGRFARSDVGELIVLARQGNGFLALREEWEGLYVCGEYRIDGFSIPETPVMFMPFDIDFDKPVQSSTRMRTYTAGENPRQTAEYDYSVTVELQALEDMVIKGREIRNCAVLVRKVRSQGAESVETFWLAPTVGLVKMRFESAGTVKTSIMQSCGTDRGGNTREFSLKKYFPLEPGKAYDYRDQVGTTVTAAFGGRVERLGRLTVPYTDPDGDVYYLSRDDSGLTLPLKYLSSMGMAFASLPPDGPPVLLPARSAPGRLNHSLTHLRTVQWPSLQPMLDFYPENEMASVIVGIEDVTVPAGTYRNCLKLCVSSITRSYEMQREKIRSGFIWLAPGVGKVKSESVSLANTYMQETPDYIFQNARLELVDIRKIDPPKRLEAPAEAPGSAPDTRATAENLVWQDNSRAMFDAAVNAAPFFVRRMVRGTLMDAVIERAGHDGAVTEDAVIAAVQATTPEKMRGSITAELEQMKTR